jgi:molecular chaperone HtpG
LTGDDAKRLATSPQLEGFRARDVEVLLLADPVDAFWVSTAAGFDGKPFKSISQGAADIKSIPLVEGSTPPAEATAEVATLIAHFKQTLESEIEDARASDRLTDSVACLVAPEFGPDRQLERMLASHGRVSERVKPVLEINATHPLTAALAKRFKDEADKSLVDDAAWLLLDEARLVDGETLKDAPAFAARLRRVMEKALR